MRKVLIKIAFFLGLILIAGPVLASGTGLVDSTYKYAWSDKMGWINFGCSNCGVAVSGSAVTGYAWSENYGWINLTGVSNDGAGVLSGYAWGEDCGWIDFSGVSINGSGNLVGATTGDAAGIINFSCDNCTVKVDWNASSGGGVVSTGSGPPSGSYSVFIRPSLVNSSIVTLSISANPALPLMAISNTPDFEGVVQEPFTIKRNWDLCPSGCKDTTKAFTVYVKFYNSSGYSPEVISAQVVLDNKAPEIAVSRIKPFKDGEPVVISGSTEAYSDLTFSYYGRYGLSQAGDNGEWKANLGVLPPGDYELVITATDLAKNSATSTVFFTVLAKKINIVDKIVDFIFPEPEPIVNISKTAPEVMKGDWNIIPEAKVNKFVFDPLPREISALAQKFPKLSSTFKKLGIGKASDVSRLQSIKLTLPTLTQTTDLPSFTSIPLAKLTFSAKKKIPTEIVFVRAGAELVDFGVTLSLGDKGNIQQVTSIIANQPLRLVVKPEGSVNSVKGYILFKSKTPTISSIPLDSLTASLMFSEPKFAKQETPVIDQEFLINEFEYKDDDGDGIYIADILGPAVDAEYEIVTVIDYVNTGEKTIRMIALVDPEGYIYEREGNNEIRINGAIISLYWLDQERREYILWPAKDFNQQNPQTTDRRGTYSFLVPEGMYSLKVQAPGYLVYEGKPIEVKVGSGIHQNIELKTSFWLLKYLDWRTLILLLIGILLIYNFYRDIKKKI